jgi:hypothetical protein
MRAKRRPKPDPLPDPRGQRAFVVLAGDAVERPPVRAAGPQRFRPHVAARRAAVQRRGDQEVLAVDRCQVGRVDDDRAEHAGRDVLGHRSSGAVVHPYSGAFGAEPVHQALARLDRPHRTVRSQGTGVEVDAATHRAGVDQRHLEHVAHPAAQRRARHRAAERPHCPARCLFLQHGQLDAVHGRAARRRQDRVVRRQPAITVHMGSAR